MPYNGSRFGTIYNEDIEWLREDFERMVEAIGMPGVKYYELKEGKKYDGRGFLRANYKEPEEIGILFHDHPDQKTLRNMGWVAELQEGSILIEVPFNTPNLQVGAIFELPAGVSKTAEGRLFRVISMSNAMLSPVSFKCELALEYESLDEDANATDFSTADSTVLVDYDEEW